MADYSHLKKLDVTAESEAEYVFDEIWGEPSIWCRPQAEANVDYMNERVRLAVEKAEKDGKETRKKRREKILAHDRLEEDRDNDRVLIARTCALRWGTAPRDVNGNEVEFSEAECLDFLRQIPTYMLDPFRGWISNVYNFVDRDAAKPAWAAKADELGNDTPSD